MDLNTLPKTSHLSRENSSSETNVANVDAVDVTDTDTDKVTSVVAKALSSVVSSSSVNKNKKLKNKEDISYDERETVIQHIGRRVAVVSERLQRLRVAREILQATAIDKAKAKKQTHEDMDRDRDQQQKIMVIGLGLDMYDTDSDDEEDKDKDKVKIKKDSEGNILERLI